MSICHHFREFIEHKAFYVFHLLVTFFGAVVLLSPPKFVVWICLLVTGFMYVSGVTEGRCNPIADRHEGGQRNFFQLLLLAPLSYLAGPIITIPAAPFESWLDTTNEVAWRVFAHYFLRIWLGYIVPFVIGLHFTYFDHIESLSKIECSERGCRQMGCFQYLVLALLTLVALGLVGFHVHLIWQAGSFYWYLGGYIGAIVLLICASCFLVRCVNSHSMHVHHYQIVAIFIPLTRFDHPISAVCQALLAGISVEGIARWGMDAMFEPIAKI